MAKEAQEPENDEQQDGAEAPAIPMFSKTGKIVFISVVAFIIILFAGMLVILGKPPEIPDELKEKESVLSVMDLNAPTIDIDKPIIISIPTNELATEFRHLAIKLTIVIGRLKNEQDPNFDLVKQLTAENFLETAEKFRPYIANSVNQIASSYTYLQLQEETTKIDFRQRLRQELNQILKTYRMQPRITEVLILSFIFSD